MVDFDSKNENKCKFCYEKGGKKPRNEKNVQMGSFF